MKITYRLFIILSTIASLTSCHHKISQVKDSAPRGNIPNVANIPNAAPKVEPRSKYGNPESYVVFGKTYRVLNTSAGYDRTGIASWYGTKFHSKRTSSGEPYDMFAMTAANKELPLPTYVRVTNLQNRRTIIVKVNDRGPFHENRIIDLSYAAAIKLGISDKGTGLVRVTAIDPTTWRGTAANYQPLKTKHQPGIYIQIGAYGSYDNASRQKALVSQYTGYPVEIYSKLIKSKSLYLVQVGPVGSVEASDALIKDLRARKVETITVIK